MAKRTSSNIFDNNVQDYDDWFNRHEETWLSELILIKSLLPKSNNCLEIGVGTGRFAQALNIKQGIDPSYEMKLFAENKGITVQQAKAEKMPFPDNSFDCLLMVTTICFIENPELALTECSRILKNNGYLVLGFIDKNSTIGQRYLATKEQNKFYKNAFFYSTEEINKMLTQNNFKIKEIKQTLFEDHTNNTSIQPTKEGYGEGSFIGIKAQKKEQING
ncbi:MAG: class I SAM-dependent methyltransferase [Candidatus Margulisbacteria bacterium]|nr:class I SAM-dependent methyltransferase [Candidatus Margulisiibacteriota bacterium]